MVGMTISLAGVLVVVEVFEGVLEQYARTHESQFAPAPEKTVIRPQQKPPTDEQEPADNQSEKGVNH